MGANKPNWFSKGSTLREVDLESGTLRISSITSFEKNHVYNGGNLRQFQALTGIKGPEVLYVGDHIFSDIIVSKKTHLWRNLLVVREVAFEIKTLRSVKDTYNKLRNLEFLFAEVYRGLNSESLDPPDVEQLRKKIKHAVKKLEAAFNPYFGSLFKAGSKPSFFAMQVQRYADLYTSGYENLLNYPFFYFFTSIISHLPHEKQLLSLKKDSSSTPPFNFDQFLH